jgi:hypothetical protein
VDDTAEADEEGGWGGLAGADVIATVLTRSAGAATAINGGALAWPMDDLRLPLTTLLLGREAEREEEAALE